METTVDCTLSCFPTVMFLRCGKRWDRIKALLWKRDGFILPYKRLEEIITLLRKKRFSSSGEATSAQEEEEPLCVFPRKLSWKYKEGAPESFKKDQQGVHKISKEGCWKLTSSDETTIGSNSSWSGTGRQAICARPVTGKARVLLCPPVLNPLLNHSLVLASVVDEVMCQKYVNNMPLYQLGLTFSRIIQCAQECLSWGGSYEDEIFYVKEAQN